jgi:hypothetical protein
VFCAVVLHIKSPAFRMGIKHADLDHLSSLRSVSCRLKMTSPLKQKTH